MSEDTSKSSLERTTNRMEEKKSAQKQARRLAGTNTPVGHDARWWSCRLPMKCTGENLERNDRVAKANRTSEKTTEGVA